MYGVIGNFYRKVFENHKGHKTAPWNNKVDGKNVLFSLQVRFELRTSATDLVTKGREEVGQKQALEDRQVPRRKADAPVGDRRSAIRAEDRLETVAVVERRRVADDVVAGEALGVEHQPRPAVEGPVPHHLIGEDPGSQPVVDPLRNPLDPATTRPRAVEGPVKGRQGRVGEGLEGRFPVDLGPERLLVVPRLGKPGPVTKKGKEVIDEGAWRSLWRNSIRAA